MRVLSFSFTFFLLLNFIGISPVFGEGDLEGFFREHTRSGVNVRLRNELWDTFEKKGVETDNTFDFFLVRARGFFDVFWEELYVHAMIQGIKGLNLPENGAFGPGPLYFTASGNDDDPGDLQLVELSFQINNVPYTGFFLKAGRMGIEEGGEVFYGEPKFDLVKRTRLSERLVGNWDWVNVGRRYDGGMIGYENDLFNLSLFGANVLKGGVDFDDGYEWLDSVFVFGGAFTLKKDVFVKGTELRVFNVFYFDNRTPAKTVAGGSLKINSTGVSVLGVYGFGPGELDVVGWFAVQTGKFGELDQKAVGFIGEIGYQLPTLLFKPWLRLGVAYASGDGNPSDSDHGTFFNVVPTNHKWYGYMDAIAFSNLEDYYLQLILELHRMISFSVDGHLFRLASDDEFWIGGSGAFNNKAFGYVFFTPVDGEEVRRNLGGELDFTLTLKPIKYLSFDMGYSHFFGGKGVEVVFDREDQMNWFYVQTTVSLSR